MIATEERPLKIHVPPAFLPLIAPARYKGIHGGRGSGKSHFMAEALLAECVRTPGTRAVCIREVQKTLKESSKRLLEDKLIALDLGESDGFRVMNEVIETPGDGVITFQGMQDHNAESIKSLEGFRIAWVEEAQTLSPRSLSLLRPTIRAENSELWFSWNPRRKTDAVDEMLRGDDLPTDAIVVQANYTENKRFPAVLEQERQDCLRIRPEQYDHIWLGGYATVLVGAYFARVIADATAEKRIGRVSADPLLPIRLFADIGGTGARSDAFTFWAAQFVGREIRILNYYEAVGQPIGEHAAWLRNNGYTTDRASIVLPHDGETQDRIYDVSYRSAFEAIGYDVDVIKNQGPSAASMRIEAVRRIFPACWFNKETTDPGLSSLGWYHEKQDIHRNVGLGPDHDWSSHAADGFGLLAVFAEHAMNESVRRGAPQRQRTAADWRL
jgi:phage terminase large subunit